MENGQFRFQFNIWLSRSQRERLNELSRQLGISRSAVLRLALHPGRGIQPTPPVAETPTPE
jgi:hypothetical protein